MGRQRRNDHESPNPAGRGPKTRRQACLLKEIGEMGRLKHLPLNQGRTICNANSPDKTIKSSSKNQKYSSQRATVKREKRPILQPWRNWVGNPPNDDKLGDLQGIHLLTAAATQLYYQNYHSATACYDGHMSKPLDKDYLRDILSGTEYINIAMNNSSTLDEQAMEGKTAGTPNDNAGNGGKAIGPPPLCRRAPISKGKLKNGIIHLLRKISTAASTTPQVLRKT